MKFIEICQYEVFETKLNLKLKIFDMKVYSRSVWENIFAARTCTKSLCFDRDSNLYSFLQPGLEAWKVEKHCSILLINFYFLLTRWCLMSLRQASPEQQNVVQNFYARPSPLLLYTRVGHGFRLKALGFLFFLSILYKASFFEAAGTVSEISLCKPKTKSS